MSGVRDVSDVHRSSPPAIITRDFSFQPFRSGAQGLQQPSTPRGPPQEHDIALQSVHVVTPISRYSFPPNFDVVGQGPPTSTPDAAPQFAEQFTPLAQKPRRQHPLRNNEHQVPTPAIGSSKAGWYDANEGDLYRGASTHPGLLDGFTKQPADAQTGKVDDTASIKTASSSSSSLSGLELGRRVTQAIDKVGGALHLRRGSASSTNTKTDTLTTISTRDSSTTTSTSDSDSSSSSSSSEDDGATSSGVFRRKRQRKRSTRSKPASRRSQSPDALSTGTVRRRQVPTRREFTLMLPTPVGEDDISVEALPERQPTTTRVRIALPPSATDSLYTGPMGTSPLEQPTHDWHGRLITTPALKTVTDKIRDERKKSGYEAAFQAETEKREARERRKRKRRSHHQHHSHMQIDDECLGSSRHSSEEGRRRKHREEDDMDPRTRRRTTRNRLEQLRGPSESHKVRFNDPSGSLSHGDSSDAAFATPPPRKRLSDPGSIQGNIVRPKSASDLLGLRDTLTSSSSTSLQNLASGAVPRPLAKRGQPFKLPPRPVFNRAQTANGSVSAFAKSFQPTENTPEVKKGCWWLDVSCPTWQDLRDLGELLHLHPLTLEDVLQQDPREKIDVFEKLGYHFIVFRAIDETYFKYTAPETNGQSGYLQGRRNRGRLEIVEDRPGKEGLEGVGVGGLNVYIVVFADGVVSFHNDDISKHTERVREKILTLQRDTASPEWIAHGLLDSIVDAFFPLISHIDDEVDEIDTLVIDPSNIVEKASLKPEHLPLEALNMASADKAEVFELEVKEDQMPAPPKSKKKKKRRPLIKRIRRGWKRLRKAINRRHSRMQVWVDQSKFGVAMNAIFAYLRKAVGVRRTHRLDRSTAFQPIFDRTSMLQRMTEMRRLVTGLTRLLGAKHQVVTRLKKRATMRGGEVGVYISDVQDHIIMLQTSLLHYEYILSHCQPAYMAHLQVTFAIVRSGTSDLILALSVVGIGILPLQLLTSLFGTNVHLPRNGDEDFLNDDGTTAGFSWFGTVLAIAVLILIGYACLVKFWKKQAREKGRIGRPGVAKQSKGFGLASTLRRQWESTVVRFRKGV